MYAPEMVTRRVPRRQVIRTLHGLGHTSIAGGPLSNTVRYTEVLGSKIVNSAFVTLVSKNTQKRFRATARQDDRNEFPTTHRRIQISFASIHFLHLKYAAPRANKGANTYYCTHSSHYAFRTSRHRSRPIRCDGRVHGRSISLPGGSELRT
jgi:hypothetical protein